MLRRTLYVIVLSILFSGTFSGFYNTAQAATIDELKNKIEERNNLIKQLTTEIAQYENRIGETSAKAKTLQNAITELNDTIKKLEAETIKTQHNIVKTNYTIQQLELQIAQKERTLTDRRLALKTLLKEYRDSESQSTIEQLLSYTSLGDAWNYYEESVRVQVSVNENITEIQTIKEHLETEQVSREKEKRQYETYRSTLSDQQKLVEQSKKDKNTLLTQTKNTEASYRKALADKQALKNAFERELRQYESELKIAIDPTSIPQAGKGVLGWPLSSLRLTQEFGDTAFSRSHISAYNGNGHNGVDFAASVGTAVLSSEQGKVLGTGDTDQTCPGASYGKWILIEHPNGLSTLYAHLSLIKVSPGQVVTRGQLIGYTGMTGYSTGPHLHFTVYASQGVRIMTKPSRTCRGSYTMPFADLKAYLNPMLYL